MIEQTGFELITHLLESNEKILWFEQSEKEATKESKDYFYLFLGFLMLFFATIYAWSIFWLFGVIIGVLSIIMLIIVILSYRDRFIGRQHYFITTHRIYVVTNGWKKILKKVYQGVYSWDIGCELKSPMFYFKENIGITEIKNVRMIQIKSFRDNKTNKSWYNFYFKFGFTEGEWNFKFAGILNLKSFLECIINNLNFTRSFRYAQPETYIKT